MSILGALGLITGGVVLLVGGLSSSHADPGTEAESSANNLLIGGGVATGLSAAMFGGGIGLAVGGATGVEIVPAAAPR